MTGIRTRPATQEYRDGWDRAFLPPEPIVCPKCQRARLQMVFEERVGACARCVPPPEEAVLDDYGDGPIYAAWHASRSPAEREARQRADFERWHIRRASEAP